MEHIRETLQSVFQELGQKKHTEEDVYLNFRETLAAKERRHIKCHSLKAGVLTVNVDSSAWLYQLSLKKSGFIKKLGIKDIRFRIGEVK
jgi:predicted nucleic acid-binding Zn ribbon protein